MPTENHDYSVPNEGAQDWHEPLNENFERYDTDIEIRDEDGNRGNYEPKAGAKFFGTDTGTVWLGDGSNWNRVPASGSVPTLSQAVLDSSVPLLQLHSDGEELAELAGETSGSAGRITLSLYDAGGGRMPVLSADRDDHVGIGAGGSTMLSLDGQEDFVGVGRDDAITGSEYFGVATPAGGGAYGGMYVDTESTGGLPFYGYATAGDEKVWHYYDGRSDEWVLDLPHGNVTVDADGNISSPGNKNFVQSVDTTDGEREVVYTATEAGTPHTEASGVAELDDGRAAVDLPDHFGWVTSAEEPIHAQTTPHSADSGGLAVVERSTDRLVVVDLDGAGDYEFSYTVTGTREGREDKEVVREPTTSADGAGPAAPADD